MFLDPTKFSFVAELESQWETICKEFQALSSTLLDPWVQQNMHDEGWSVYGLYALGKRIDGPCDRCPQTAKFIENISGVSLAGFSMLAPRIHIKPHVGWAKSVTFDFLVILIPFRFSSFYAINLSSFIRLLQSIGSAIFERAILSVSPSL